MFLSKIVFLTFQIRKTSRNQLEFSGVFSFFKVIFDLHLRARNIFSVEQCYHELDHQGLFIQKLIVRTYHIGRLIAVLARGTSIVPKNYFRRRNKPSIRANLIYDKSYSYQVFLSGDELIIGMFRTTVQLPPKR